MSVPAVIKFRTSQIAGRRDAAVIANKVSYTFSLIGRLLRIRRAKTVGGKSVTPIYRIPIVQPTHIDTIVNNNKLGWTIWTESKIKAIRVNVINGASDKAILCIDNIGAEVNIINNAMTVATILRLVQMKIAKPRRETLTPKKYEESKRPA
jgi:hypothetical protein